jgi:D-cysteine desulfhydrase
VLALIARYPELQALPRVALCDLPTPLEPFDMGLDGVTLSVKRDDLTSTVYGGNKARKLEPLLAAALAEERTTVLTFGAYGSNHALATAVHARALGLEPHVVLSPQAPGPFAARTLRAHAGLGTVIHPVEGWDGSREAVRVRSELTRRDGVPPYVIPMGGTNALGAVAYVNAALEVLEQGGGDFERVYVAGGTLGTAVGLSIGFAAAAVGTRVEAVRVTPGEVANEAFARDLCDRTVSLLREMAPEFPPLTFEDLAFTLRDDRFEPGYGVVTDEALFAVEAASRARIRAETTYTGKALAALIADARDDSPGGGAVLFWDTYHSGSMPPCGSDGDLPRELREYVAECDRLFGG